MAIQKTIEFRPLVEYQPFKISFWNLVHVIMSGTSPNMQILGQISSAGVLPKYVKYYTFLTVFTFFSILSTGQTLALVHTLNDSNDVFPRKEVPFGGLEWRVTLFGGNMPQPPNGRE